MLKQPTYPATQLKQMALTITDYEAMTILSQLISEEIGLYSLEDMQTVTEASLILFNRSLLMKFLK